MKLELSGVPAARAEEERRLRGKSSPPKVVTIIIGAFALIVLGALIGYITMDRQEGRAFLEMVTGLLKDWISPILQSLTSQPAVGIGLGLAFAAGIYGCIRVWNRVFHGEGR